VRFNKTTDDAVSGWEQGSEESSSEESSRTSIEWRIRSVGPEAYSARLKLGTMERRKLDGHLVLAK
jgi:hypothetical protein